MHFRKKNKGATGSRIGSIVQVSFKAFMFKFKKKNDKYFSPNRLDP